MQKTIQTLTENLKKYCKENNFQKAVVGVSGGVDSACTLAIGIKALGKENITAILMPETGVSSNSHLEDARNLVKLLDVQSHEIPIKESLLELEKKIPWKGNALATMNMKARIRMLMLYHYANTHNAIVLGTGNKTEMVLGYGTKYGDFGVDIEVLGKLWKTEVFQIAKALDLPEIFYTKAPSAELVKDQTDEKEIGASYEIIDRILQNEEKGVEQIDKQEIVRSILNRVAVNKHKTESIPIL
jgi:NAD+ synthase